LSDILEKIQEDSMFRNLSPKALGITGRQSEIIELALTYGFRGLELDIYDFAKRVGHRGLDHASRFIRSSQLKIGGFELPIRWRADEATFKADLEKLPEILGYAVAIGGKCCHTQVLPGSNELPYHENFELHRKRLATIGDVLLQHGVRLGIGLLVAPAHRQDQQFQFIREAESLVTLLKSIGSDNVGLMLDTWNWHFAGGTLDALRGLGEKGIVSAYLADAPADATADTLSEDQRMLPYSEGPVNNLGIVALLNELGYRGPVTLAPNPRCVTGKTRDAIVQHCGNLLEDMWRTIGLARPVKAPATVAAAAAAAAATPAAEDVGA
jgi:sugar phosphate isomerase/epimerase